jgi:hypothetical protein
LLIVAFAASLAAGAAAQEPSRATPRGPVDPDAKVAPVVHQSPFAGYRPFADAQVGPWRAVNDEVGRIGGWKVYAREVFEANEAEKRGVPGAGTGPGGEAPAGTVSGGR